LGSCCYAYVVCVRISELHSVLKGPKAKDVQVYITMRSLYKGQIRRHIHIANTPLQIQGG
jgi:hypothetical protein